MQLVRFLLAALIVAALVAPSLAQPPVAFEDAGIHAVQFIDQAEGWAVGDDGVIWHSIDGGKTWERQKTGTRASLRGVHFQTPYTGWVVGRRELPGDGGSVGVMLRTTDGGITWREMGTNVLPGLHVVRFFDEKTGFVCGDGSPGFPSGMFSTADGGQTWKAASGVKLPSCRAAAFLPGKRDGVVAGAWSRLGTISDGAYKESDFDPLSGRSLHAVCIGASPDGKSTAAFAVGDGAAVLVSNDGGKSWGFVNLGLAPEVLAACDFRCCAAFGPHVWVAGQPGGFVLHSADGGKTWELQRTELPTPVNGIHFLTHEIGWMVGELGCIYGTTDGGKTWKLQRTGGQRAAVLCLQASHGSMPLDVVSVLGYGEGYRCAAMSLMSADPATGDPKRATEAARLRQAMRLAGGVSGDVGWAFPLAAHAAGLPPRELMASWDRAHAGKAAEQLLRQAVLAIRMWQPEVILADCASASAQPADVLALHAANKAFKQAADPNCFPEQITKLGLKPWTAKKLYAISDDQKSAAVLMDQSVYHAVLAESPKDFAEIATRIIADDSAVVDRRAFVLVAHCVAGAEKHKTLMEGIELAHGGAARRRGVSPVADLLMSEGRKKATESRRRLDAMMRIADPELAGAGNLIAVLGSELKKMPDDIAARTAHAVATRFVQEGKWTEAREVFDLLSTRYPGHPLAIEGYRWLLRYLASTEVRHRLAKQLSLQIQTVSFEAQEVAGRVIATDGTTLQSTKALVHGDRFQFDTPDAIQKWHQSCLDLEPRLLAFGPIHSRDPSAWLSFLAARRQVGRHNDAITFIRDYFKNSPGAAEALPGLDAWRDCLAAELWMTDRNLVPIQPKLFGICKRTEVRPLLDGQLDDACWRDATPMSVAAMPTGSMAANEMSAFKTEARFAYDEKFLYVAITCNHPSGMKAEPVAKRTRDANVAGHDRVDVLLDLDRDYQTYYRFQVDHRGCLAEDCWGDKSWNPKYFAAHHATETGWTAELAIPIPELTDDRPSHGKTWAVNVSRIVPTKGMLTWSGPADEKPRPEGLGLLQFRADK